MEERRSMKAAGSTPPELVIFDCDGTLVDSEGLSTTAMSQHAARHGLVLPPDEALELFRGARMSDCVAEMESRLGRSLPDDFVPTLREATAKAFRRELHPIPGALELVASLEQPSCVASSGPLEKMRLSLGLVGLLDAFEERLFSAYEINSWKPEPDLFLHAAGEMRAAPERCAVVEDSLPGVLAGMAAGMKVFALQPHGVDPRIPGEVTVVESLTELGPWFRGCESTVDRI